jgi:hypothetical protein
MNSPAGPHPTERRTVKRLPTLIWIIFASATVGALIAALVL